MFDVVPSRCETEWERRRRGWFGLQRLLRVRRGVRWGFPLPFTEAVVASLEAPIAMVEAFGCHGGEPKPKAYYITKVQYRLIVLFLGGSSGKHASFRGRAPNADDILRL